MQKSWATELKIHILPTDEVIALFFANPMTYHLEHMDEVRRRRSWVNMLR